jgi:hypothetical protein
MPRPSAACTQPQPTWRTWKLCRDEFVECLLLQVGAHAFEASRGSSLRPAVVHVGANLGFQNHNDPMTKLVHRATGLRVVLVEPQPSIVARLRNATAQFPNVAVHHSAVCRRDVAALPFYEIDEAKVRALTRRPIWL